VTGTTNGRAWTYYAITTPEGETFSTFHKSHRATADEVAASGALVRLTWTLTKKGGREVVAIEALEPTAAVAEAKADAATAGEAS